MKNSLIILLTFSGLVFAVFVFGQNSPDVPTSLSQYRLDCSTLIPAEGWTNQTGICLKGNISDPDSSDQVKLQVELTTSTQSFANIPNQISSSYCTSPCISIVNVSGLLNGNQYKWQAQSSDDEGATSNWVKFNDDQIAFGVDLNSPTGAINATPTEVRANQIFNIVVNGEDAVDMGAVCYKEETDLNWTCSSCLGTSTSCSNNFIKSKGVLGKYKYYGLVADVAENSTNTDPNYISVLVETDPSVRTDSATDVQADRATLKGELLDMGGAEKVDVWFNYGPTLSYGSESSHILMSATGAFSVTVTGFDQGTNYHFRAVAKNGAGTSYGQDREFLTLVELIKNGGFETGNLSNWTSVGDGNHEVSTDDVHSGIYAGLIGYKTAPIIKNGKSAIYQEVSIPSGATKINLSFWYKFYTSDRCPYDYIRIYLKDTSDTILKTYLDWCCEGCEVGTTHTYGWNQITDNDLISYAGKL